MYCCRPYGTVQLSITATHVASSKVEQDGMSDVSFMSSVGRQSMGSAASSGGLLDTDQVSPGSWACFTLFATAICI